MSHDLRPLGKALRELNYAVPLAEQDPRYIKRPDALGDKVMSRIEEGGVRMLLVAGPTGCGKTTELLHYGELARKSFSVFVCPYDRDAGTDIRRPIFFRYLLWRLLYVATCTPLKDSIQVSAEITRDALRFIGTEHAKLPSPAAFFARMALHPDDAFVEESLVADTVVRLLGEIKRFLPVLLFIDGLEKLPLRVPSTELLDLLRSVVFDECQTVVVVPPRLYYGAASVMRNQDSMDGTSLLRITTSSKPDFVRAVITRRAEAFFSKLDIDTVAKYSGGLIRDGLQLAADACQNALDDRLPRVESRHVQQACAQLRQVLSLALSDEPDRARKFLRHVQQTKTLPGDRDMREMTLSLNMVIEDENGSFRIHPLLENW